jgi:hypothetical protein
MRWYWLLWMDTFHDSPDFPWRRHNSLLANPFPMHDFNVKIILDKKFTNSSSIVLTRLSGPHSRPATSQKMWYSRESNPDLWICSHELWPLTAQPWPQVFEPLYIYYLQIPVLTLHTFTLHSCSSISSKSDGCLCYLPVVHFKMPQVAKAT